jgi:hypothetical protein
MQDFIKKLQKLQDRDTVKCRSQMVGQKCRNFRQWQGWRGQKNRRPARLPSVDA